MKKKKLPEAAEQVQSLPNSEELELELKRERYKYRYRRTLQSTVFMLITAAAVAVLVATLWLPVLQIYGSSMTPTLNEGEIVLSVKSGEFEQGDIVAFYYGNKLLVKRYIAGPGDWIDIDERDGTITVNGVLLNEPYVVEHNFGGSDLDYPYQVPEGRYFLVGDHRATSVDSRHTSVGCVGEDQIVGTIVYCIWPLSEFGALE